VDRRRKEKDMFTKRKEERWNQELVVKGGTSGSSRERSLLGGMALKGKRVHPYINRHRMAGKEREHGKEFRRKMEGRWSDGLRLSKGEDEKKGGARKERKRGKKENLKV